MIAMLLRCINCGITILLVEGGTNPVGSCAVRNGDTLVVAEHSFAATDDGLGWVDGKSGTSSGAPWPGIEV